MSNRDPLTKRMRTALSVALSVIADGIYDDVEEHGGTAITPSNRHEFAWLAEFPILTWPQGRRWRRDLARAADDLAHDIDTGGLPEPRCPAEEAILWLAIRGGEAETVAEARHWPISRERWLDAHNDLVQDWDIGMLWDAQMDGREEPSDDLNQLIGMGDHRPEGWFTGFDNMTPRDPKRGYRR